MVNTKPFDQKIYDKHDSLAKQQLLSLLTDVYDITGYQYNEHESDGTFADGFWDLLAYHGRRKKVFEVERKNAKFWGKNKNKFPLRFPTIDIPARKKKNKADIFALFSTDDKYAVLIKNFILRKRAIEKSKNTIYQNNEPFLSLDVKYGIFFEKINGKWKQWHLTQ